MYLEIRTPLMAATVEAIVKKVAPEKIYLLGTRKVVEQIENTFNRIAMPEVITGFQFLILLPPNDKRNEEELCKAVDKNYPGDINVTSIIVPLNVFNKWLQRGNLLAHNCWHSRQLVYDGGRSDFSKPGKYDIDAIVSKVQQEATFLLQAAWQQFNGAVFYSQQRQYGLAAFALHQTAEQSLMGIIRLVTGYRAGTHNLQRLLRCAHVFCGVSSSIFSAYHQQDKQLLKLLQDAYIGARYRSEYQLSEAQYKILEQAVEALLSNVKAVFKKSIHQ